MPHNQLRLVGGTVVNETPVINQAGIAVSNRIRFKPDSQGLSLPEKLGGWSRFYASTITAGVVRALWGWQDTNNAQWIAFAADSSSATELGAIQCTVNGSTGLTSATGSLINITPNTFSTQTSVHMETASGSNLVSYSDPNVPTISPTPNSASIYITNPVSVGGIVLNGQYALTDLPSPATLRDGSIVATDILGNPLNAVFSTGAGPFTITTVTFTSGTPNTLTISFSGGPYTIPVGDNVNVVVADNSIDGSYIVLSSTSSSVTVATTLGSYTFSTSGSLDNFGVTPIYAVTPSSLVVTVTFPFHGQIEGGTWTILNPTTIGGITLYGEYTVQTVPNAYTFTILAPSTSTAGISEFQYQNAIPVTGGTSVAGVSITLDFATNIYTYYFAQNGSILRHILVRDVVFSSGAPDLFHTPTVNGVGTITYSDALASGSWVSGGTWSPIGGVAAYVYNIAQPIPPANTTSFGATFWTFDSFGNDLIACPGNEVAINYPDHPLAYQPIYYWDPTSAGGNVQAQAIPNGPVVSNGAFVAMPERQIVAWGSSLTGIPDPLLVRWCDVNNFNVWVAQITNQAGSFRLASGAKIVGGRQAGQQGLLWTDIELWAMQYINQPLVYGFNKIGQGCGLIGKYAHGILGGVVYWMSKSQFFMVSGEGVIPLPCPVWDVAFQDLDLVNVAKITCATNAMFQEVAWYFPVKGGSGENSQYVKYNVQLGIWDYGTLDRSAWIDVSILQQPIGFSPVNKLIYQHEISPDADGAAMGETFTTGWFAIAEGDVMPYVDQFWPDMKWGYFGQTQNANITMSFAAQAYPGATQYSYGPYTVSQSTSYISPRIRNRLINFTISGTGTGTWWRLGGLRYRFAPDGKF